MQAGPLNREPNAKRLRFPDTFLLQCVSPLLADTVAKRFRTKRWLRRWTTVRHREAAERTLLTAISAGASSAVLADALLAASTERAYADTGHSLDFINKAFECLDLSIKRRQNRVKRTLRGRVAMSVIDPKQTWASPVRAWPAGHRSGNDRSWRRRFRQADDSDSNFLIKIKFTVLV